MRQKWLNNTTSCYNYNRFKNIFEMLWKTLSKVVTMFYLYLDKVEIFYSDHKAIVVELHQIKMENWKKVDAILSLTNQIH